MTEFDRHGNVKTSRLTRRAALLGGVQLGVVGLIGWRMHQLGVTQSDQFRLLAEENRINIRLVAPARGLIYDRDGEQLTINNRVYTIEMVREQAKDPEKILRRLQKLIPLSDEQIAKALEDMARRKAFVPVTVATGLQWEHIATVSANSPALPGVTPQLGLNRSYNNTAPYGHIVGYVGRVSDYDLKQTGDRDPLLLLPRFQIGKHGVEAKLEKSLRGKAGVKRIEVNAIGRVMRELDRQEGEPGVNVQLTIGRDMQTYCLDRLAKERSASAVVMDVRNGDILALASAPTFDPNKFTNGISQADWDILNNPETRPMFNKASSGAYSPGSTFKMVVALAALEEGLVTPEEEINCTGHTVMSGRKFHCWRASGHGKMNLRKSLRESCDVYYYELALRVGIEKISAMAQRLGIGTAPNVPLPAVHTGLAPTKDWKLRRKKVEWVLGDSMNAGIGQGFVLASPLQLAVMTARLATGTKIEPRLLNMYDGKRVPVEGSEPLDINPEHLAQIRRGMFEVSNHRRGTAFKARIKGATSLAGKTGTTQVRKISAKERRSGVIKNEDLPWRFRDHALFVCYAPHNNPRYAVSVVVEHGGGGSKVAAPIARDIMKRALDLGASEYGKLPTRKREQTDATPKSDRRKI